MSFLRALHGRIGRRRVEQKINKPVLILNRETNKLGLLDRPVSFSLRRSHNKIAHAAALQLRSAFHYGKGIWGDSRLDPRGSVGFLGHLDNSLFMTDVRVSPGYFKGNR